MTLPPDLPAQSPNSTRAGNPSRQHTAGSAAILLMASSLASGLLALIRIKYVNHLWGAGIEQDAYQAAFTLPDLINYFLIGGAASISVITILNRYRESGDEPGGDRALSVILTTMSLVLGAGILLGEVFAPGYVWLFFSGYRHDPVGAALCTSLTRLILPAQLFFFIGSVMSSRLQVRKIFLYQAFTPLIYNIGIIAGAFFLHNRIHDGHLGIHSLAWGVLAGVILGSALLNSLGAFRTGLRFRPILGFRDPAFIEWLKLSLPLMIGVSLVTFDGLYFKFFASAQTGGITLITNAKNLFNAPFNVIGPAAGAASLPFFASLFQKKRAYDFSASVARSVSRLFSVGLIVSAWMIALAPWLMDLFRGGRFNRADTATVTQLFSILAITLAVWAVQGIYARAFYAASDTRTPMLTGTLITALSAPMYWALFHALGLKGLAIASDIGIVIQTAALTLLLHKKRLVSFAHLEFAELGRALFAALVAFAATAAAAHFLPPCSDAITATVAQVLPPVSNYARYLRDFFTIAVASVAWATAALFTLLATGSSLPGQILRRR
jgi:putative peptidoglycan lipid II flippase